MAQEPIEVGSITDIWTYLSSVDWEEPWLWVLMGFHAWCIVFTVASLTFNYYRPQVCLFVVYSALAYSSEYLNEWLATNYKRFSQQQYFDSTGMFISLVFSLPLLLNVVAIVLYWIYDLANVMIGVKRAQIREELKSKAKSEQEQANSKADGIEDTPKSEQDKKED